jgi:hypothetical protein
MFMTYKFIMHHKVMKEESIEDVLYNLKTTQYTQHVLTVHSTCLSISD